jgi:tRNA dimethylallyltransferase
MYDRCNEFLRQTCAKTQQYHEQEERCDEYENCGFDSHDSFPESMTRMAIENTPCSTAAASSSMGTRIHVVVLLGPTAVGKSDWAFNLACEKGWEILSCDSRQIYREMNIGTAKPSAEQLRQVRHWMVDICRPDERYNAFRFSSEALAVIRECAHRNVPVLICGGTGLYFKALSEGDNSLEATDPRIRRELNSEARTTGVQVLYKELAQFDPDSARKIHPNDQQRIIRALACFRQTGVPFSHGVRNASPPQDICFHVAKMTMDRHRLYDRINRRVDSMVRDGLYDEYRRLRKAGYDLTTPGLMTVGYRELFAVEQGTASLEEAADTIRKNTRRYAKRQITWFTRQVQGEEFNAGSGYEDFRIFAENAVRRV